MVVRDLVCMWGSKLYFLQFDCLFFSSNFLVFFVVVRDLVCMWGSMLYFLQFVCLFFSSNFLVFCGGSGLGVYVGEHALLSFVCRRA